MRRTTVPWEHCGSTRRKRVADSGHVRPSPPGHLPGHWSGRRESNPRSQLGNQERAYPGELQHGKSPAQRSECPSVNETEWQRPREERAMATCQQSWTVARPLARRSRASRAEAIFVWAGRLCGQEEGRLRVLRRSGPPAIDAKHLLREAGMREPTRDHS